MTRARFTLVAAVHLFLVRGDRVLLLRRFNTGYEDGKYSVIAGHLDGGEEVRAAAVREAREEAGITLRPEDVNVVGVMHRRSADERVDCFVAADTWTGAVTNREPHKCDELAWFAFDALPDTVIPYVRAAFENYRRGVWFDSFGWGELGPAGGRPHGGGGCGMGRIECRRRAIARIAATENRQHGFDA